LGINYNKIPASNKKWGGIMCLYLSLNERAVLGGENFFEELLVVFHIFCTFAPQSRAFLSQLSVTGDESGFFYVLPQEVLQFP
jgi:hypothetical protein